MWDTGKPDALHEQCESKGQMHDADWFLSIAFYCMEVFELILHSKN